MDSVSIELWLDKRQLAALEQALTEDGTTVERTMQEQLNELYAQRVPLEQQEKIQQALDAERLESQRNAEASARYAGLHITENGQEHYLSTKSGQEFLDMAILMRRYLGMLPPQDMELIQALYFECMTEREYAQQIGISQKGVNKRRQKVLDKLRTMMKAK